MPATNQQVQTFADTRMRVRCEQIRNLLIAMQDDRAVIDDIYNALNVQSPTWTDSRTDGPPHLLTPNDVLAFNSLLVDLIAAISGNGQYPIAQKACVRSAGL